MSHWNAGKQGLLSTLEQGHTPFITSTALAINTLATSIQRGTAVHPISFAESDNVAWSNQFLVRPEWTLSRLGASPTTSAHLVESVFVDRWAIFRVRDVELGSHDPNHAGA